jgi:capsular exopolysaccharide synthesis family protein
MAESRRQLISSSMNEQQRLVDRYRDASIQYNILRREVETNQKFYDGLLERLKQASITAGLAFGNIHIIEPGRPSDTPASPNVPWILGMASLVGLGLSVCFALLMDFWDTSVSTLEEAEQIGSLPALGSVPTIKSPKPHILLGSGNEKKEENPTSALGPRRSASRPANNNGLSWEAAEAVRNVCASILLSRSDQPPRIILVTSATPDEGKTTMVNYLGQAFADSGNKTLLIESDLRKPALAQALGIGSEGGLSLFLSGHLSPSPTIHKTQYPNLFAIPAGPKAPNPLALLNSEKLNQFLNEISVSYQFVILDAPPVLAVADARILCSKVDGVVLVARAGRTPKNLIKRAWALLENSGANILGMVLNDASTNGLESAYYRQYYQ